MHTHIDTHPQIFNVDASLTCELPGHGLPRASDFTPFPCYGRMSLNPATAILPVASVGHPFVWFDFLFLLHSSCLNLGV